MEKQHDWGPIEVIPLDVEHRQYQICARCGAIRARYGRMYTDTGPCVPDNGLRLGEPIAAGEVRRAA